MAKHLVRVKLRLTHVRPFVTRVFDMHSTSTLGELHLAIQAVMPWEESHLHEFQVHGASYVDPSHGWDECDGDEELYDQDSTTLGAMIRSGCDRFEYVYDMGDYWVHSIALSRAGSEVAGIMYPHLVAGVRACPLEDCGGPPGHERLLAALRGDAPTGDSEEDETASLLHWAGEFDPKVFDAVDAQARLDMTFGHGPAISRGWGDWGEPFRLGGHRGVSRPDAMPASLAHDLPAERFSDAPFIRDAALLLQMFAEEPAPVTKTGALSVKSVLRVCDALDVELYDRSAVRFEAEIRWIEVLHIVLDVAGLMRRRGNVLAPTPRGMLLADPKRRAELAATLMRTRFEEFNLAYGLYGGEAPRLQNEYRTTLSLLRKCARDWVSIDDIWRDAVTEAAKTQCVRAFASSPQSLVEHRLIRPFVEMGLLEARDLRGTDGGPRFRCAPLLDEWVHFDAHETADAAPPRLLPRFTIHKALEAFLEEATPNLSARLGTAYRSGADSLELYLDNYGPNDLSKKERAEWESLSGDGEDPRFCDIFGPEHIAPAMGMYLTWFLPKKVGVSEDGSRKATRFAAELLDWLLAQPLATAEDIEVPREHVSAARTSLPAAARFKRLIQEWCDSAPAYDAGDTIEDQFEILRVESKSLWLASYLTGEEYGPSPVSGKVASAARAGMQFSGSIVPERGIWRIIEVWTVYPE